MGILVAGFSGIICNRVWHAVHHVSSECTLPIPANSFLSDLRIVRQEQSLAKMTAVWLLPVVTLIVASSTGGLLAKALLPHSTQLALLTTTFSFVMVLIGLSLALMIITVYLLRLITYGAPDITLVLSSFIVLGKYTDFHKMNTINVPDSGPLGQGGYALLLHGENMAELLPLHFGGNFPFIQNSGQMIFAVCFAGSFILWSMGIAWIIVAILSIFSVVRKGRIPFSMAYWGMVFPHGTFASLSVKMALVLDSPFYRGFGALWCCAYLQSTHFPLSEESDMLFERCRLHVVVVDVHTQHSGLRRRFAV